MHCLFIFSGIEGTAIYLPLMLLSVIGHNQEFLNMLLDVQVRFKGPKSPKLPLGVNT